MGVEVDRLTFGQTLKKAVPSFVTQAIGTKLGNRHKALFFNRLHCTGFSKLDFMPGQKSGLNLIFFYCH
jgi:hypothetical protein